VAVQFDVEAALRRHVAIPQTRDRRYNIKLYQYPAAVLLDNILLAMLYVLASAKTVWTARASACAAGWKDEVGRGRARPLGGLVGWSSDSLVRLRQTRAPQGVA
jgi:hypothetical protein